MDERKSLCNEKDLDSRIEKIVRKCLSDFQPTLVESKVEEDQDDELMAAANFFDED